MKLSFLFILLGINFSALAQLKPIYFYGDQVVTDSTLANAYGVYGKLSSEELYVLKMFDLDNNLKLSGSYKDADLKIAHGDFVFYTDVEAFNRTNGTNYSLGEKARFISGKGSYVDGSEQGRWIEFYPDGKVRAVVTYVMGIKHGFYGVYSGKGKTITSGAYKLDQQDGEWFLDSGKVRQTFIDGVLQPQAKKNAKNGKDETN
jgi:antitoxin component YwqK of YwqJK toxin-antitoxin module